MSIFPKRARPGQGITVHWSFRGPEGMEGPIFPFVRIGVRDPEGGVRMLCEKILPCFPEPEPKPAPAAAPAHSPATPAPSLPLLILASYLEGRRRREELACILRRLREGRHYYFQHSLPQDAPLGMHTLVSEIRWEGRRISSGTAEEDFFHVERLELESGRPLDGKARVRNPGPEAVPARLIETSEGGRISRSRSLVIPARETVDLEIGAEASFLSYCEEREVLVLGGESAPFCHRNPDLLVLPKEGPVEAPLHLLYADVEAGFLLEEPHSSLWTRAEGFASRDALRRDGAVEAYDEMLAAGLLQELPVPEDRHL